MKKGIVFLWLSFLCFSFCWAQENPLQQEPVSGVKKVMLLISEQNIEGPRSAWWVSEIDLSATEAHLAKKLIDSGYVLADPGSVSNAIKQKPAFRLLDIQDEQSIDLGKTSGADYIVLGKAVASRGGNVPASGMFSCFANITAKLIRAKDGTIIQYLDAQASSVHTDVVTGGREALTKASEQLAQKIIESLKKEGVRYNE